MDGTSSSFSEIRPDAEESQHFWRDIWGKEVLHNENACRMAKRVEKGKSRSQTGVYVTIFVATVNDFFLHGF